MLYPLSYEGGVSDLDRRDGRSTIIRLPEGEQFWRHETVRIARSSTSSHGRASTIVSPSAVACDISQ